MKFLLFAMAAIFLWVSAVAGSHAAEPPSSWTYEWKQTDFSRSSVEFDEIRSGGPPKDGIPAIDQPKYSAPGEIDYIGDQEPVITVTLNGETRAYPVRILIWHEIANDTLGGVPISVTFCPLCNSALVFDRRVAGRVLDFGTTGKLRNSDLVMYDRQTESWWQQFTGEAIIGEMTGTLLTALPSRVESFERFLARTASHEGATVLVPTFASMRNYGANPYSHYDRSSKPFLYSGELPQNIAPLARVVVVGKEAWSLELVQRLKRIERGDLIITWEAGQNSALDSGMISMGRDIGNVVVQRQGADAVHDISFAFAFHAFHPEAPIHTEIE
ncbi:MAG: DUF3179 domain-containing protein [Alphaproteobacteria bacterium]|jgi:hypothetical protein|nr:DUF3179 domain-containing protein [Alphaproteobacteria bacterium]MDP6589622.1 DUF3179 domain-containing protein [Alphaproteobacteria bacterium]MDP6816559.1 DUF3179 domain-containing protein [Alphaproteobacteria bacterium]|tara:strand:+ start:97 stop:1083 length:987 start_codon:yes stop_codon:yes gene_type:complete